MLAFKEEMSALEKEVETVKSAQETKSADLKSLKKQLKHHSDEMSKAKMKASQLQTELEQQRSNRQRVFQRAKLEEISLPLLDIRDLVQSNPAAAAANAAKKRKRSTDMASTPFSASELLASESFSPTGLVGTATLDGSEVVDDGERQLVLAEDMVQLDFSQLDEEAREADPHQLEREIMKSIELLIREQVCVCETLHPSHIIERPMNIMQPHFAVGEHGPQHEGY